MNGSILFCKITCRPELQKLVGHTVSETCLRKVASQARRLSLFQPEDHKVAGAWNGEADENTHDVEFGADLILHTPSRFLVDVSLDDGDILGVELPSSLTSSQETWFNDQTTKYSQGIADGTKYDLNWLRNECDRIVISSASALPRDELAMAVCRVLDSGKPGEEVTYFPGSAAFCN